MGIKLWAILIAGSMVLGYITWYVVTAENAKADRKALKAQIVGWNDAVITLTATLENNKSVIADCRATNEANTAEIGRINSDLDKAEARVTLLDGRSDDEIESFKRDADSLRGTDATCRTLDDPLPDSFVGSVRKPAAAGSH